MSRPTFHKPGKRFFRAILWLVLGLACLTLPTSASALELFLALDISGSMRQTDPQKLLPQAARLLVTLARSDDRLGFLTFEDGANVRVPLGKVNDAHRRLALRELRRLDPRGLFTDLDAALSVGLKALTGASPTNGRGALVLLTDGKMDINPAKGTTPQALERLRTEILPEYIKRQIPIYTVAFTEQSDQALLRELATQTGGRFYLVREPGELHQAFAAIYDDQEHPQMAPVQGNKFVIDPSVKEATVIITREVLGRSSTLVDPGGVRFSYSSTRPPMQWFAADAFDMVTIPQPKPGTWRLEGQKEEGTRVLLLTDLTLACPFLPYTAGVDEELLVTAGLEQKQVLAVDSTLLATTTFTATLYQGAEVSAVLAADNSITPRYKYVINLTAPGPGLPLNLAPGLRQGRFASPGQQGTWDLRIQALGKTFQRERHFRLEIGPPWFTPQAPEPKPGAEVTVDFKTDPRRQATNLSGWVGLQEPTGLVQAIGVAPGKSADFQFAFQPPLPGLYHIALHLSGLTDSGRPLLIHSAPLPVTVPAPGAAPPSAVTPGKTAAPAAASGPPAGPSPRARKWLPWIKIASMVLAAVLVVLGVVLLLLPRLQGFKDLLRRCLPAKSPPAMGLEAGAAPMSAEQENLLLKAQVESLKDQLGKTAEEKTGLQKQLDTLQHAREREKQELTTQLEKLRHQTKRLPELEAQVTQAENELKNMQEEYMALYSRTRQEKEVLKKN